MEPKSKIFLFFHQKSETSKEIRTNNIRQTHKWVSVILPTFSNMLPDILLHLKYKNSENSATDKQLNYRLTSSGEKPEPIHNSEHSN